ncbi:MAG TPA: peptide chain release factor 3 [Alphaproteobacteria bacterium]|nr:peptide chain release factor 3 [Alphaproteobacteria bacterium]HAJ45045.1 peptide chain release factor 3 [Alphaproteobacteria bacterium]
MTFDTDPKTASARRRTFAIISHPDAGKTTLTEHLLLMGGAIRLAGEVKAKGDRRRARSDWMKIEQERGISVTTAVMTFEYRDTIFNLLDTPGHEDFSEDTYRTLTAADSAIMVIDAAKGIEAQTRKLFEVCRLRDIPITTFINKMDRETRDPFSLIDEIADTLQLHAIPMMWPVGQGLNLRGAYRLEHNDFVPFSKDKAVLTDPVGNNAVSQFVPAEETAQAAAEMELARAYGDFDLQSYREGHTSPVYFGSALKHFGVRELLEGLAAYAPSPRAQKAATRTVTPEEDKVTGFVFKVQANMDPNHRDRVAFIRLCSGRFKRGMKLKQIATGKMVGIHNPILFFAQDRETVDEAWPGDIIGVPNHGILRVGDTLTEGEDLTFTGIPNFAPEILRRVRLADPMKAKHLQRALESLAEEGVTQVFKPAIGSQWIVGVVGQLQLDVLASRMAGEYGLDVGFEPPPFELARWVDASDPAELKKFISEHQGNMAEDRDGAPVFLAKSAWELRYTGEKRPAIQFSKTRERQAQRAA